MENNRRGSELEAFYLELSAGDPDVADKDREIGEHFLALEAGAETAKARVRVSLERVPVVRRYWPAALALCGATLLLFLMFTPSRREPLLSPDWRADYNFSASSGEIEYLSPDWRADYQFGG